MEILELNTVFFSFPVICSRPITRTPDNSNLFQFPLNARVIGSRLYLEHLQELDNLAKIRMRSKTEERKAEKEKDNDQYDWLRLVTDG